MAKKILIIENDLFYIGQLKNIIQNIDFEKEYDLIYPDPFKLSFAKQDELYENLISGAQKLIEKSSGQVIGVFVDIRLFEDEDDISGIRIAMKLKEINPMLPVVIITSHFAGSDIELFGETTLLGFDGVLPKNYFKSPSFTKGKLTAIFENSKKNLDRNTFSATPSTTSVAVNTVGCDIAIITALSAPEFSAFTHIFKVKQIDKNKLPFPDTSTYFEKIINRNGKNIRIVAASDNKMGMPASTSLASRIIQQFSPKYIIMLGICAGIKGRTNIGDVLVASFTYDYGSGKMTVDTEPDGKKITRFIPYNQHLPLDVQLQKDLSSIPEKAIAKVMTEIKRNSKNFPDNEMELKFALGPFASGAAVIADTDKVADISTREGRLIGFDMEAYGVFYAAENASHEVKAISIKAVSDFGTEDKATLLKTAHQQYAATNSVLFFKYFLEKILAKYL